MQSPELSVPAYESSAEAPPQKSAGFSLMTWLLIAGIGLRLLVFITAYPFNPDTHYEVIQYIVAHGELPISNVLGQSYHPPLYHLLMAPLEYLWHSPRPIQFASFLISSFNLFIIRKLLDHPLVMPLRRARLIAMAGASFLPQYVMFGNFVSNDTLAILIGTLIFAAALRYLQKPSTSRMVGLAALIGAGLLTKGTFLLTGPAMSLPVFLTESRRKALHRAVLTTWMFCMIWVVVGHYKYMENYHYFGRFFVHNLDAHPEIVEAQKGTWKGWQTLYDINVLELVRRPILQVKHTSSYPLLFYATFWYPHYPDSSFHGNVVGYQWVGSLIYALAIVPTVLFFIGIWQCIRRIGKTQEARPMLLFTSLLLLLANFIVVGAAAVKYDAWPNFQSRLCFPSMMPMLVIFGAGMETFSSRPAIQKIVGGVCALLAGCCILYFLIEFALVAGLILPGPELSA